MEPAAEIKTKVLDDTDNFTFTAFMFYHHLKSSFFIFYRFGF